MDLTREYLDQALKAAVAPLATKTELIATETRIIKRIDHAQEELARRVATGFDDVIERLDVRARVFKLESDVHAIKEALHLSA